jgi:hypothetical protein
MREAFPIPFEMSVVPPFTATATLNHVVHELHRPLFARCTSCSHSRRLRPMSLAAKYGWEIRMEEIARRLRCIACGSRDCQVIDFDPKAPPPPVSARLKSESLSEREAARQARRRR